MIELKPELQVFAPASGEDPSTPTTPDENAETPTEPTTRVHSAVVENVVGETVVANTANVNATNIAEHEVQVLDVIVVNLTDTNRMISVLHKLLGQSDGIRFGLTKVGP